MSAHREQELKFRISEGDHAALRNDPTFGIRRDLVCQTNHYFDTEDLALSRLRILLRIRREEPSGRCVLTLKRGKAWRGTKPVVPGFEPRPESGR